METNSHEGSFIHILIYNSIMHVANALGWAMDSLLVWKEILGFMQMDTANVYDIVHEMKNPHVLYCRQTSQANSSSAMIINRTLLLFSKNSGFIQQTAT